jgi:hypothetical protein
MTKPRQFRGICHRKTTYIAVVDQMVSTPRCRVCSSSRSGMTGLRALSSRMLLEDVWRQIPDLADESVEFCCRDIRLTFEVARRVPLTGMSEPFRRRDGADSPCAMSLQPMHPNYLTPLRLHTFRLFQPVAFDAIPGA